MMAIPSRSRTYPWSAMNPFPNPGCYQAIEPWSVWRQAVNKDNDFLYPLSDSDLYSQTGLHGLGDRPDGTILPVVFSATAPPEIIIKSRGAGRHRLQAHIIPLGDDEILNILLEHRLLARCGYGKKPAHAAALLDQCREGNCTTPPGAKADIFCVLTLAPKTPNGSGTSTFS